MKVGAKIKGLCKVYFMPTHFVRCFIYHILASMPPPKYFVSIRTGHCLLKNLRFQNMKSSVLFLINRVMRLI